MTKTGIERYRAEREGERQDGGSEGKMRKTEKEREKMAEIKGETRYPGLLGGGSKRGLLA